MEGAGEGVVAVLEGTKNADLKVTMLPKRLYHRRKCVLLDLGINPSTRLTQSSVETGTDRVVKDASSRICDIKYSSSYQFADCVRNSHQTSSVSSKYRRHGGFTRHSGLFEDSLRKYPDGTASSEILERIINYTNTEQNNRRSNLRSIRKSTSYNNYTKCDTGVNTNNMHIKKPLRPSVSTIGNKYSSQKELQNYTYDYLKGSSHVSRCSDVRYLTQIKKCLRDRLLELIDDKPTLCPRIRSRYSHHRRKFHKNNSKQNLPINADGAIDSRRNDDNNGNPSQMESSFSRHKPCFFHQPKKCVCKTKSNNMKPLESLMTKLYSDLIVNGDDKTAVDRETLKNQDLDNVMYVVSEWLEKIPVFANFTACDRRKQEEMAHRLAKNLSKLKYQKDFVPKAKLEIMEYLNSSPIWQPTELSAKNQFFETLAFDLIQRLNNMFGQEVEQNIAKILSRLPYKEGVYIKKIQEDFMSTVKPTILQIPKGDSKFKRIMKPKVLNMLRKLPVQTTVENLHELTDEIVDHLSKLHESAQKHETVNNDDKFKENIMNFCENVPELANINFSDDLYLIDELVNKFKEYENENLNDEDVKEKLKSEVQNWLNDVARTKNIRLNSDTKNQLSIKMLEHILGTDYNEDENKFSDFASSQVFLEPLQKWFFKIPQFEGDYIAENRKDLAKLAKDLKEIHSRKLSKESTNANMKNLIYEWLQNKFVEKGKHVESKDLDNLVNNILSDLTDNLKRIQKTEEEDSHLDQDKDIMKLLNKFNNIRRSFDSTTQINDAVSEFIQSLSENVGVDVDEGDVKLLKDKLFARWRQTSKKRKRWDKLKESYPTIQSKIKDVLKEYPNSLGNSNFDNIGDKIFDAITKNIKENSLLNLDDLNYEIRNVLRQETELMKSDQEVLANRIFTKLQKVLPQEVIRRSRELGSDMETSAENSLEPKKKLKKQKSPRSSSIEDGDEKYKIQYGRKMNFQAGDVQKHPKHSKTLSTIYQSSHSDLNVQNSIDYSGTSYKNRGDKKSLAFNKHKNIRSSTPISTKTQKRTADVATDSSTENFTESSGKKTLDRELSEATKYHTRIKNITMDWLKNNELIDTADLNTDEIVSSIASDFVERQKYLQLSGKKYSENDELEHLKYQIFRKINKMTSYDKIPKILSEINGLHSLMRKVSTPKLVMSKKSKLDNSNIDHDSMFNVIKEWLNSISPKLLKDSNIKNKLNLAKKIANKLENIEKDGSHDYEMQKEILIWLQNILNIDVDKTSHDRTESAQTQPNDLTSTKILDQKSSTDVDETILESILKWIKNTSFHKVASPEEKDLQKNLALFLATNLKNILKDTNINDVERNDLLMEEVQKYLKTIINEDKFKNNTYCTKAAAELVNNIKKKLIAENKLPETITEANNEDSFIENENLIRQIVTSWCDSLPIHLGHDAKSKEEAEKLKQEIAKQILENSNILNLDSTGSDIPLNVMISDEIDKIFYKVPMNRELEKSLPVLKSILIDKIVKAKTETNIENKNGLQDTLTGTLQEIENVSDLDSSSFVLLKEKLVNAFLDLHYDECVDDAFRDKLKYELGNVVHNFCHEYLQRNPSMPLDTDELRHNLSDTLKKALKIRRSDRIKKSSTNSVTQFLPSSSLSPKDKDHLERIRKRVTSYHQKDSIVIPTRGLCCHSKDIEIQTDLEVRVEEYTQTSKTLLTETGSFNREIFPQVVIKEYYWDSNGSKQSLQMFGPPEVSTPKSMPKMKETRNSQNQTEVKLINKYRKVHISQQFPETNTVRETTSTCGPRCQNIPMLPPLRELIDRQQQRENISEQRSCNRNKNGSLNNNINGTCWWEQPGILEHTRHGSGRRTLEDSVTLPDDRIVLRRRMCFTSDNRSKEHTCCDRNASWRLRPNTCRLPNRCSNKARHCSKCSGGICPHPSLAFFSKEF